MRFEISSLRRWPYYDVEPSAVAMVESACITWLLYLNHIYGIQPISAISVYLAIAITIHGAGWWLESHSSQTTISSSQAKFLGRLVLLILHEIPKWHLLPRHWQKIVGLQSTFGLFGRSTAIWLCPTLASGFWTSLTMSDLSGLPRELLMRGILSRFGQLWSSCQYNTDLRFQHKLIYRRSIATKWVSQGVYIDQLEIGNCIFNCQINCYHWKTFNPVSCPAGRQLPSHTNPSERSIMV